MGQVLRVLIAEDNEADAALLLRELKRGGYELVYERVDSAAAMRTALEERTWDLVVSDFSMPQFDALAAIDLVHKAELDLPFLIVSGTIGEEAAVEAMRAGAHDFMAKGKLSRLLPAITRELREAAIRAEHRTIEHRLRQAQKMEAIGQLTGGIAHDFNNLLGVVVGNVDLLLELVRDQPGPAELAQEALDSALRGAELTKRLLAFARQQPLTSQVIDVNERLPGIVAMLRRTLGEGIRIDTDLAREPWPIRIDPSQLEDALLNLAINARDAMPDGGNLTVETDNIRLEAHDHAELEPGDYVTLSVTDTGAGMPPEIIERVIEPFFTTKGPGKGTGLGLSMIYGFVKQSGGQLSIYSEVGVGTTIRIYLPRHQGEGEAARPPEPSAAEIPTGGERVLVVDDNAELRRVAIRVLTKLGYAVGEAADGIAALGLIEAGRRYDLLFTDIGLPFEMNGIELAERAQRHLPGLKVLYTTGYGADRRTGTASLDPATLLRKPYRSRDLAGRVRAALDGSGGGG